MVFAHAKYIQAGFISQRFGGQLATNLPDPALHDRFTAAGAEIGRCYEAREYGRAMREIMALADAANRYVDEHKPWVLAKDPASLDQVHGRADGAVRGRDAVLLREGERVADVLDLPWADDDPDHWERAAA